MTDRDEIERIINLYGHILDEREWDRLGEVFAQDGSFVIESIQLNCRGLAEIDALMRSARHPLAHYSTNIIIDVIEGADHATALVKVWAPRASGSAVIGSYRDDIVRTPAGWRFLTRDVRITEMAWRPRPRHVNPPAP
jgi:hypothetical protein